MDANKLRDLIRVSNFSNEKKRDLQIKISTSMSEVLEALGLLESPKPKPKPAPKKEAKPFQPSSDKKASVSDGK